MPFVNLPGLGLNVRPYDYKLLPLPPPRTNIAQAIAAALSSGAAQTLISDLSPLEQQKKALQLAQLKNQTALLSNANANATDATGAPLYTYGPDGMIHPTNAFQRQNFNKNAIDMQRTGQVVHEQGVNIKEEEDDNSAYAKKPKSDDSSKPAIPPQSSLDSPNLNLQLSGPGIPALVSSPSLYGGPDASSSDTASAIPAVTTDQSQNQQFDYPTTTPEDYWSGIGDQSYA